jgi:hypothetical protein
MLRPEGIPHIPDMPNPPTGAAVSEVPSSVQKELNKIEDELRQEAIAWGNEQTQGGVDNGE